MVQLGCRRAFSLIELLVVITIIALWAALLFPVFASAKRQAMKTSCLSNMHQLGVGIGLYEADSGGLLPVGTIIRWQNTGPGGVLLPPSGTRDVMRPILRYAPGLTCPVNHGAYLGRWVQRFDTHPNESRVMLPEPSNVLAYCIHHLDKGWSTQGDSQTFSPLDERKGKYVALRADLSSSSIESSDLRKMLFERKDGQDAWSESDSGQYSVFRSEAWPPKWQQLPEDLTLNWGMPE